MAIQVPLPLLFRAILYPLRQARRLDTVAVSQVGNRPTGPQNAVITPRARVHLLHRRPDQCTGRKIYPSRFGSGKKVLE